MRLTSLFKQLNEKDIDDKTTKSLSHKINKILQDASEDQFNKEIQPNTKPKPWNIIG